VLAVDPLRARDVAGDPAVLVVVVVDEGLAIMGGDLLGDLIDRERLELARCGGAPPFLKQPRNARPTMLARTRTKRWRCMAGYYIATGGPKGSEPRSGVFWYAVIPPTCADVTQEELVS
jgi:hypothetical protein